MDQEKMDGSPALIAEPFIEIQFQLGPIKEVGLNGTQMDRIVEILIARLQGFQKGKFQCRENAQALSHLERTLHWLQERTKAREARRVEGKNLK